MSGNKNKGKKRTNDEAFSSSTTATTNTVKEDLKSELITNLIEERKKTAKSILEFNFKKKRVEILSKVNQVKENTNNKNDSILYWMYRDCRVQDNWALLFAQKLALKNKLPLTILYCLPTKYLEYNLRHYKFILKGLEEIEEECLKLNIKFNLKIGSQPSTVVTEFIESNHIVGVIVDFLPLRDVMKWQESVLNQISEDIPFIRVDAHNIVPCWVASNKLEYAARTIRNKINNQLSEYLTEYPTVIKHPYNIHNHNNEQINWKKNYNEILNKLEYDKNDELINDNEVEWLQGGYQNGIKMLESFQMKRIKMFATKRNDPCIDALSNLSPWLHFGHISAQRCVLVISKLKSKYTDSVNAYCEEVIIRRELSDNYCYYNNEHYDTLKGGPQWSQDTLNKHKTDKRVYLYTLDEFKTSHTHDDLWNSAQIELVKMGKLHGFMRMYWCKKILEWSETPEMALKYAIYLNDHYALDGNDPNGYVGIMWSICGVHDQGWMERDIFGKIRFMNYNGCKRKFDIHAYIARWGGKIYNQNQSKNQCSQTKVHVKKIKK